MPRNERADLLSLYAVHVGEDPKLDALKFLEAHPEANEAERHAILHFEVKRRRWLAEDNPATLAASAPTLVGFTGQTGTPADAPEQTIAFQDESRAASRFNGMGITPDQDIQPTEVVASRSKVSTERTVEDDSLHLIESGDRFAVRRHLGSGGMGVVYEVFDRKRSEVVALKIMKKVDPNAIYQFKQEFRALADLSHPNLLNLYELFAVADRLFFTMELVEGTDFLTYVRGDWAEPNEKTASLLGLTLPIPLQVDLPKVVTGLDTEQLGRLRSGLAQLVDGIDTLHHAKTLHRDIKPSNVLVTNTGRVVILDFGLATETTAPLDGHGGDWTIVGTVAYMSPEQAQGRILDPAADWYSVGVILYEALTGVRPIEGNFSEIMRSKQTIIPIPPGKLVDKVPKDLDQLCMSLLAINPSARPKAVEITSKLRPECDEPTPQVSRGPISVPLIGRTTHREFLDRAFMRVVNDRHAIMVSIHGRSGIGKSALVHAFLEGLAHGTEAVILSGRCYERESVPYKALDSLVDALGRYLTRRPLTEVAALLPRDILALARVFPVLRRVEAVAASHEGSSQPLDPQQLRRRAFTALRSLLKRLGALRPLVLCIDDLQWGDVDSAALLGELLRPPDAPAMLLIGSYRSEDIYTSPFLAKLRELREHDTSINAYGELEVEALSELEATNLALALLGPNTPPGHALAIARESGGNPFFVQELAQHVLQDEHAFAPEHIGSIDLDDVLWRRVQRLSQETRGLLEVVSVSGRPINQSDALASADLGNDGRSALTLLRTGRLIRFCGLEEAEEIEAYHDRIRETVIAHISTDSISRHHGRLAATLERSGRAGHDLLAVHYLGSHDDCRAAYHYRLAADQAHEALAFDHAATLYGLSLQLDPLGEAEGRALRTKFADALANAGRCVEAAQEYLRASIGALPDLSLELRQRSTLHFLTSGHLDEGFEGLHDVLSRVNLAFPSRPWQVLAWLIWSRFRLRYRRFGFTVHHVDDIPKDELARIDVCWSAGAGLGVIDTIRAAEFQARGLRLALKAGEPNRLVRSLAVEAAFSATGSGAGRKLVPELLKAAGDLAKFVNTPYAHGIVAFGAGLSTYMSGNWKKCLQLVDEAESIFRNRCTSVTWELDTTHVFALWSLKYLGEIAELQRRWPILLSEAHDRGDLFAVINLNTYLMSVAKLAADDSDFALKELQRFDQLWKYKGFHLQHHGVVQGKVYTWLYREEPTSAWNTIQSNWANYQSSMLIRLQKVRIDVLNLRANAAISAARAGHRDAVKLRKDAAWCAKSLAGEGLPWPRAISTLILANLAADRYDWDRAATTYRSAAEQFDNCEMKVAASVARRRMGEVIGGDQGKELIDASNVLMAGELIVAPQRFSLVYCPGLRHS